MIHQIYANESNVGDWMSAIGIRQLLDEPSSSRHFCDEYFLPETLSWLKELEDRDVVVIGGGGLFQPYFLPFWRGVAEIMERVPVCLWGVGLCGQESDLDADSRDLLRQVARRSRLCVVRDEMTRHFLDMPQVGPPVPCPSIVAAKALPVALQRRVLLHSVHADIVPSEDQAKLRDLLKHHAAQHCLTYMETDNRVEQGNGKAMREVLALYGSASMVVSSRLHGCILGLAMGCKVLALVSDPKVEAFMCLAGMQRWIGKTHDEMRLGELLKSLDEQDHAAPLIERAHLANARVARTIRQIVQDAQEMAGNRR